MYCRIPILSIWRLPMLPLTTNWRGWAILLRRLEKRYELVIIDTPPVLLVPDAVMILEVVKNAVAVVRAGRSRKRALEALCKHLPDGTLVGTILNEGALPLSTKHYGYYGADADPDE